MHTRTIGLARMLPLLAALALSHCAEGQRVQSAASSASSSTPRVRRSIAEAIRAARPGDVVALRRGIYAGGIWVESSGAPGRPIVVRPAEGPGTVVIEGGEEGINIAAGAHDLVFEGLEVRGSGNNLVHIQDGAHRIVLRDLHVHHAGDDGDGIKINQAHDILIERVECHHPGRRPGRPGGNPAQECIDLVDAQRVIVQDSYLHDGGNMLLYAKGGSHDVIFQRNVIVGQGGDAIDPCVGLGAWTDRELLRDNEYEAQDIVFRNNVVSGCRAGAIGVYDARRAWIVNNTLVDNGAVPIEFRAGNAPLAESRDVHVINNVVADTRGRMESAMLQRSHEVRDLEVRNNLYWNGGQRVPAEGLVDPNREPGGLCTDPRFAAMELPSQARVDAVRAMGLGADSAAIDRAVELRGPGRVVDDLFGRRRPHGRGIDLGAIEFGATEALPHAARDPWPSEITAVDPVSTAEIVPLAHASTRTRAGCARGCARTQETVAAGAALAAALTARGARRR
jgi:nitrous oxidase accessory protein NosD